MFVFRNLLIPGGVLLIGTLLFGRHYKRRIGSLEEQVAQHQKALRRGKDADATADYMTTNAIIDRYLQHATVDMRPGVKLTIRTAILERFEKSPGAMLGEGIYSREHLHLWMQTNMARLFIRHRRDL